MSALLFSSSPHPCKQAKIEEEEELGSSFLMDEGDDLEELLLKELEKEDFVYCAEPDDTSEIINSANVFDKADIASSANVKISAKLSDNCVNNTRNKTHSDTCSKQIDVSFSSPLSSQLLEPSPASISTTLAFCENAGQDEEECSAIDSVYNTIDERGLPMIDFNTPHQRRVSLLSQKELLPELIYSQNQQQSQGTGCLVKRLMVAGNFRVEDLQFNVKSIGTHLHMNPIEAIKQSDEKRVNFLLALMLRDFRQIGPYAQLRLLDGSGNEITGTMPFSACEKDVRLTYGLILVLSDVTVIKTPGGTKYLNISKNNIHSYYNNIKVIE